MLHGLTICNTELLITVGMPTLPYCLLHKQNISLITTITCMLHWIVKFDYAHSD